MFQNTIYFMDQMMFQILAQVHYMPDTWKMHSNSYAVRDEFVKLFQYKFVYLIEELLSPVFTPFVLLFWLRPRAHRLVDFLRNFTVEVVGVGDVCSFAQMDTRRHGNPTWLSRTANRRVEQARNGKTELSLIHFAHTNPNWKMPVDALAFIEQLRDKAIQEVNEMESSTSSGNMIRSSTHVVATRAPLTQTLEAAGAYQQPHISSPSSASSASTSGTGGAPLRQYHSNQQPQNAAVSNSSRMNKSNTEGVVTRSAGGGGGEGDSNPLTKSLYHLNSLVCTSTANLNSINMLNVSTHQQLQQQHQQLQQQSASGQMPRGAVSRIEGPLFATNKQERQTLLNIAQASTLQLSQTQPLLPANVPTITTALENSLDMCFSALYMHEVTKRSVRFLC